MTTNRPDGSADVRSDVGIRPDGYRLPDAARLGVVRLQIGNLDRSLAYYAGFLGFRILSHTRSTALLGPNGAAATPLIKRSASTATPVPCHDAA